QSYAFAATSDGYAMCFSLLPFVEPSTRAGRRFARPKSEAQVVHVQVVSGDETVVAITQRRVLLCPIEEVNYLSSAGRGVMLVKLGTDDGLLHAAALRGDEAVVA